MYIMDACMLCVDKNHIVKRNLKCMCYAIFMESQIELSMIWMRLL